MDQKVILEGWEYFKEIWVVLGRKELPKKVAFRWFLWMGQLYLKAPTIFHSPSTSPLQYLPLMRGHMAKSGESDDFLIVIDNQPTVLVGHKVQVLSEVNAGAGLEVWLWRETPHHGVSKILYSSSYLLLCLSQNRHKQLPNGHLEYILLELGGPVLF